MRTVVVVPAENFLSGPFDVQRYPLKELGSRVQVDFHFNGSALLQQRSGDLGISHVIDHAFLGHGERRHMPHRADDAAFALSLYGRRCYACTVAGRDSLTVADCKE